MPWAEASKGYPDTGTPAQYIVDTLGVAGADDPVWPDAVRAWRRESAREREEIIALQKACGKEGREAAKWYSELAAQWLRTERACGLLLGWLGDGPRRPFHEWPKEIAAECDRLGLRLVFTPPPR